MFKIDKMFKFPAKNDIKVSTVANHIQDLLADTGS